MKHPTKRPIDNAADRIRENWTEREETFDRVYDVILGITEFTHYADIAELVGCSDNTARKHLDRLAEIGVLKRGSTDNPTTYCRNDFYLKWKEANYISNKYSGEEIIEKVRELEVRRGELKGKYEEDGPGEASIYKSDSDDPMHEQMKEIAEWQGIEEQIQLYELARQLSNNDGYPALS